LRKDSGRAAGPGYVIRALAVAVAAASFVLASPAWAQTAPKNANKKPVQRAALPAPPQDVSGPEMSMLIRGTVVALHQANVTGNYTVLRDLGASVLRASNSAADLAVQFTEFRQRGFNLAPTVLFDAVLDQKPKLTKDGVLQLIGHFPTKPQEVIFDLTYRYELGAWRIAVLRVGSRMAVASAATKAPAQDAKTKPKAAAAKPAPRPEP
jgi:hypothetical protein